MNLRTLCLVIALSLFQRMGLAQAPELRLGVSEGVFDSVVEVPLTVSSPDPFDGLSAVIELDATGGEILEIRVAPDFGAADFVETVTRGSSRGSQSAVAFVERGAQTSQSQPPRTVL